VTIDEEAAAWAVRVDNRDLDSDPCPDLERWLQGDPRRRGAFIRAQAALSLIADNRVAGALQAAEPPVRRPSKDRRRLLAAAAGGGMLAAAGVVAAVKLSPADARYSTGLGEIRQVPLADGTRASINTSSAMTVALRMRERRVVLEKGEAWFQVAHDAKRPFVVRAGDTLIKAIGTAFSVRQLEDGAEVIVTEGLVEASCKHGVVRLAAGSRLRIGPGGAAQAAVKPDEIASALAWREGEILLDGQSVEAAAAQFNRYNRRRIEVDDPALAKERFVGLFRTNDPAGFAAAVAASLGADVVETADAIRLKRKAPEA